MALTNASFIIFAVFVAGWGLAAWLGFRIGLSRERLSIAREAAGVQEKFVEAEQKRPDNPIDLADRVRDRL